MATLSSLPVDIFHHVIDELPVVKVQNGQSRKQDLKSLRLSCREIETKTRRRFGQEFFGALAVTLANERRFESAHRISANGTFSNRVTQLCVRVHEKNEPLDSRIEYQDTMFCMTIGDFKSGFEKLVSAAARYKSDSHEPTGFSYRNAIVRDPRSQWVGNHAQKIAFRVDCAPQCQTRDFDSGYGIFGDHHLLECPLRVYTGTSSPIHTTNMQCLRLPQDSRPVQVQGSKSSSISEI